jgi:5-methylcytosine-specific restriction endonuclease McrA
MPLRACTTCGRPTIGRRCAEHALDRGYNTQHWQQTRRARLTIDGYRCQLRHPGCSGYATTVHLDPECKGDHSLATIDNTLSACASCHGTEDAPRASGYLATSEGRGAPSRRERQEVRQYPAGSKLLCTGFR